MDIPKIKTNPDCPHHYIFSIQMAPANSPIAGNYQLRTNPLYFHNDDVEALSFVVMAIKDKIFKITEKEALQNANLSWLVESIHMIKLITQIEQGTMHHLATEYPIPDHESYFNWLVNSANTSEHYKEILNASRI